VRDHHNFSWIHDKHEFGNKEIISITSLSKRRERPMLKHVASIAAALAFGILVAVAVPAATDVVPGTSSLTVHEWGTFTSVAGERGQAVEWLPVDRQNDLPCFVNQSPAGIEDYLAGTVRMETPVLYFYTPRAMKVTATVRFPTGWLTEWYPQAKLTIRETADDPNLSTLEWRDVTVLPNAAPSFPVEPNPSHYYAARQTDAAPLRVKDESEKFLFYRGVGNFPVPISARVRADGKIRLWTGSAIPITGVILFESRGGKLGYRAISSLKGDVTLDPPILNGDLVLLQRDLERILMTAGLYPKEAAAMVATWRDSWFEEGTRVFYIVPPSSVDANLPLKIEPQPAKIARAFVGRIEVITAATERAVADAIRTDNKPALDPYKRFLRPIMEQLLAKSGADSEDHRQFQDFATVNLGEAAIARYVAGLSACPR
jgi:hypothetical protein